MSDLEIDFENFKVEPERADEIRHSIENLKNTTLIQDLRLLVQELGHEESLSDSAGATSLNLGEQKSLVYEFLYEELVPHVVIEAKIETRPQIEEFSSEETADEEALGDSGSSLAASGETLANDHTGNQTSEQAGDRAADENNSSELIAVPHGNHVVVSAEAIPPTRVTHKFRIENLGNELRVYFRDKLLVEIDLLPKANDYLVSYVQAASIEDMNSVLGKLRDEIKRAKSVKHERQEAFKGRFNKKSAES